MRSPFLQVLGAGCFAIALWASIASSMVAAATLAITAVLVCWFSTATYEVSDEALLVKIGAGVPHLRINGSDIASVERSDVGAIRSGGLGYRGSWTIGKRVIVSLGGLGGVTVHTRPKGALSLSSDHADRLESAIQQLAAMSQSAGDGNAETTT